MKELYGLDLWTSETELAQLDEYWDAINEMDSAWYTPPDTRDDLSFEIMSDGSIRERNQYWDEALDDGDGSDDGREEQGQEADTYIKS